MFLAGTQISKVLQDMKFQAAFDMKCLKKGSVQSWIITFKNASLSMKIKGLVMFKLGTCRVKQQTILKKKFHNGLIPPCCDVHVLFKKVLVTECRRPLAIINTLNSVCLCITYSSNNDRGMYILKIYQSISTHSQCII